jgi:hypothetical protein
MAMYEHIWEEVLRFLQGWFEYGYRPNPAIFDIRIRLPDHGE